MAALSEYDALFRTYTAEPSAGGRWSSSDVANLVNRSIVRVMQKLRWPESTYTTVTVSGQREYQLPELMEIVRVYLAGEPIAATTIPHMEGAQLQNFAVDPALKTPIWLTGPGVSEPQTVLPASYPGMGLVPMYQGAPSRYYLRGGYLGFAPPPLGVVQIRLDVVAYPVLLLQPTDQTILPSQATEAVVWGALERAYFADDDVEKATYAAKQYEQHMGELLAWKKTLVRYAPRGPMPITGRTFFDRRATR